MCQIRGKQYHVSDTQHDQNTENTTDNSKPKENEPIEKQTQGDTNMKRKKPDSSFTKPDPHKRKET